MAEFTVDLVAVEARFWRGQAKYVSATTSEGEIGLYAGHEPLFAQLAEDGVVKIIDTDDKVHIAAVAGGFLSVTGKSVTILAEMAVWATDVDVEGARARLAEAEASGAKIAACNARGQLRAARRQAEMTGAA